MDDRLFDGNWVCYMPYYTYLLWVNYLWLWLWVSFDKEKGIIMKDNKRISWIGLSYIIGSLVIVSCLWILTSR